MKYVRGTRFGSWLGLALGLSVLLVAGCGGNGGEEDAGGGAADITQKAESKLRKLYEGTYHEPPGGAPAPAKDKSIWVITVGIQLESVKHAAEGFAEAAGLLGWDVEIVDGRFDPTKWLAGVRDAILADPDGIWIFAFDCSSVRAGLEEAKRAGIPVVISAGADCKPSLVDHVTGYAQGSFSDFNFAFGEAQAWWVIAKTDGEAKVILFKETDIQTTIEIAEGVERVLELCSTCEILEVVEFTGAEVGPKLQEKAEQALLQNPDANVVVPTFEGPITGGVGAAVRAAEASGRDLIMTGGEGFTANVQLAHEGLQDMGVGYVGGWEGWLGVDAFLRIFAGEEPIEKTGLGVQVWDRQHNLPAKGESYNDNPPIDFKEAYKDSWGVE